MGCQIYDDMMDLARDILMDRHNYIASAIWHETGPEGRALLEERMAGCSLDDLSASANRDVLLAFPGVLAEASATASRYLKDGAAMLFREDHQFMIEGTTAFVRARIGVDSILD
jgi:hypothetical protein